MRGRSAVRRARRHRRGRGRAPARRASPPPGGAPPLPHRGSSPAAPNTGRGGPSIDSKMMVAPSAAVGLTPLVLTVLCSRRAPSRNASDGGDCARDIPPDAPPHGSWRPLRVNTQRQRPIRARAPAACFDLRSPTWTGPACGSPQVHLAENMASSEARTSALVGQRDRVDMPAVIGFVAVHGAAVAVESFGVGIGAAADVLDLPDAGALEAAPRCSRRDRTWRGRRFALGVKKRSLRRCRPLKRATNSGPTS